MSASVRSVASTGSNNGNVGIVVAKPAGTVDGDVLIAFQWGYSSDAGMTAPVGWTLVGPGVSPELSFRHKVWKKVAASEPATYQFEQDLADDAEVVVVCLQNASGTIDAVAYASSSSPDRTADCPSVDPTATDCLLLCGYGWSTIGPGSATSTPPAGMTEIADLATPAGWEHCGVASLALTTGAVTGTKTATSAKSNSDLTAWATSTIAVAASPLGTNVSSEESTLALSAQAASSGVSPPADTAAVTFVANDATAGNTTPTNAEAAVFALDAPFETGTVFFVDVEASDPVEVVLTAQDAGGGVKPSAGAATFAIAGQDAVAGGGTTAGTATPAFTAHAATGSVAPSGVEATAALAAADATVTVLATGEASSAEATFTIAGMDAVPLVGAAPPAALASFDAQDATVNTTVATTTAAEVAAIGMAALDVTALIESVTLAGTGTFTFRAHDATIIGTRGTCRFQPPIVYDRPLSVPWQRNRTAHRLLRHFGPQPRGRSVLKFDGVYVTMDCPTQDQCDAAEEVYIGGHVYDVPHAVAIALESAGYEVDCGGPLLTLADGAAVLLAAEDALVTVEHVGAAEYAPLALAAVNAAASVVATSGTQTFSYTGGPQTFEVPAGVTSVLIDCQGGEGQEGNGNIAGGMGARVVATLAVTPAEMLQVNVGGVAFGGGGLGGGVGNDGGGASDVRQGGTAYIHRKVVAGGGGGGGDNGTDPLGTVGGHGGTTTGEDGTAEGAGGGGQAGAGGTGGASTPNGADGALGVGGAGGVGTTGGGGGGGGYYGGGGGSGGANTGAPEFYTASSYGGGGGSSFTGVGTSSVTHTRGYRSGNGVVVITWS